MTRWALVTGAARGIGEAVARQFAKEGICVALVDRKKELVEATCESISAASAADSCRAFHGDVRDGARLREIVENVERECGPIDVLVNNAGYGGPFHRIDQVGDEEWAEMFATNVRSVFQLCREVLPRMAGRGHGRVVNIASVQGLRGAALSSTYVACKHAVVGYTKALADEWGPSGVTVNCICPGYVRTSMGIPKDATEEQRAAILNKIPIGRDALPEEIAAMVWHLSRADAGCINGASIVMDGGQSIRF